MGPVHRILLRGGVVILEGLALGGVPPGEYELVCLPLAIVGADGAPARVLLRTP
jgi:arylformamidase